MAALAISHGKPPMAYDANRFDVVGQTSRCCASPLKKGGVDACRPNVPCRVLLNWRGRCIVSIVSGRIVKRASRRSILAAAHLSGDVTADWSIWLTQRVSNPSTVLSNHGMILCSSGLHGGFARCLSHAGFRPICWEHSFIQSWVMREVRSA